MKWYFYFVETRNENDKSEKDIVIMYNYDDSCVMPVVPVSTPPDIFSISLQ